MAKPELRQLLLKRGLQSAAAFTWEVSARRTLEIYGQLTDWPNVNSDYSFFSSAQWPTEPKPPFLVATKCC